MNKTRRLGMDNLIEMAERCGMGNGELIIKFDDGESISGRFEDSSLEGAFREIEDALKKVKNIILKTT